MKIIIYEEYFSSKGAAFLINCSHDKVVNHIDKKSSFAIIVYITGYSQVFNGLNTIEFFSIHAAELYKANHSLLFYKNHGSRN